MRHAARIAVIAMTSIALVGLPVLPEGALRALHVDERRVPLAFAEESVEDGTWVATPVEGDTTIAGLTWEDPEDAPTTAEVRVRIDGAWTDWEVVPTDDEHTPDPASRESQEARGGTAPVVVAGAEAIQFRVEDTEPPVGLTADLVDVDDPDAARRISEQASAAEASPGRPSIHPRSDWGGESCPGAGRDPIEYADQVQALFVHHTAGHTSYSPRDVPGIIRAICSYHVNGRGWDDIGYNALVDQFGGIWVGRDGGIEKAVQGAHTGGYNAMSTGVALIGHHDRTAVSNAAWEALARYAAWKLDVHNVNPKGTAVLTSAGSSRYREGVRHEFHTISGHRDASATACPGSHCYANLAGLRDRVDALGGFRVFGGWTQAPAMQLQRDGTWEHPVTTFSFSEPANWVFEVRTASGATILRRTGAGSGPVRMEWDATIGGRMVPKDSYTFHVNARRQADNAAASPADHVVALGGPLGEFDDVSEQSLFHDSIEWLALQRITNGCNPPRNTRFCPGDPVTRGQMAAFLSRALQLPLAPHARFRDVPSGHMFADAIARLSAAGITRGCNPPSNDRYCPDATVTRQEMATFLVRGLRLSRTTHPGFRDVGATNVHRDNIRRLATAGITQGCNPPANDQYCPAAPVTRQEMAVFIRRSLNQ